MPSTPKSNSDIENPNEQLLLPEWISADYFRNILQNVEPNVVEIAEFTKTAAIPPGENFTSILVRVHMKLKMKDCTIKHKTYILKTTLAEDKGGDIFEELKIFEKEMAMYYKYLPAFKSLYQKAGVEWNLTPKCLHTEKVDKRITLIFEDLCAENFKNVNRLQGLDMTHMTRCLQKLAEFHAASAVYKQQNGDYPAEFQFGFFSNVDCEDELNKKFFNLKAKQYKAAMLMWNMENAEKYVKKFPNILQFCKSIEYTLKPDPNAFNVLTHGDFWTSNAMFTYQENGSINETRLIDFQFCKWGHPIEDLIFFIGISAAKDIRIKEFDNFIAIYHERLIECLQLLGYEGHLPQLRELQMATFDKKFMFFPFFVVFNHLVAILMPSDYKCDTHEMFRDDEIGREFRMRAFTNPIFVDSVKDLFKFYHQRGLLNFEDFDN